MTLETALNNVLSATLILIATALAIAIRQAAVWIEAYARQKVGASKYEMLKDMAAMIVRSLEQSGAWRGLDAQAKKEQALLFLQMKAEVLGIKIDVGLLDHMIEEAVQVMNAELGPTLEVITGPQPQILPLPGSEKVQ